MDKPNVNLFSKADLEKEKLKSEIKNLNKSFWRQPSFWTFLLAFVATIYSWQSGLFETNSKILELKTLQLDLKKDSLYQEIFNLENEKLLLEKRYDSLFVVINNLDEENKRIKNEFENWKIGKQSKVALKNEVLAFVKKLRDLLKEERVRSDKNMNEYVKGGKYIYDNTMIEEYNVKYKTKAIIYREKLLYYLPNLKMDRNDVSSYRRPTNPLGLTQVTDNLEYMAYKLAN